MPSEIVIERSRAKGKRYAAIVDGKRVNFGDSDAQNYTMHKDSDRKKAYIARHRARGDWSDPMTAGYWAKHLLWSETTLEKSAARLRQKGVPVRLRV